MWPRRKTTPKSKYYTPFLQREVIERFEFESIHHAQLMINRYYKWYNEKRKHGSLGGKTPEIVWKKYNPIPIENGKRLNYL